MKGLLARCFVTRAGRVRLSLSDLLVTLFAIAAMPAASAEGFSAGPPLATARDFHSATLLASGKVLVAGGIGDPYEVLAGTELYDPDTGTWSASASLATPRDQQTATLLPSGEVLVVGGRGTDGYGLNSAELYDPVSETWRPAASMTDARYDHTATLLDSGRVLVTGGYSGLALFASAEIYDPAADTWTPAAALSTVRMGHAATRLASGKVLVAGGYNGSYLASTEVYDEASDTWTPAASLSASRWFHTSTLLPSGDVLVVGGYGDGADRTNAELYDPGSDAWSPAGTLVNTRSGHTTTVLVSGKVLVAGGYTPVGQRREELYIASSNSWVSAGSMATERRDHTATLLSSGKVLITGGANAEPFGNNQRLASVEIYDPARATNTRIYATSPAVTVVGQPYDVGFTVTSATGTPTGSVTVTDDSGASCGPVALNLGFGACVIASTAAGERTLTASYVPDSVELAPSSGNATHEIDRAQTTLQILGDDPDPSLPGEAVSVTVAFAVVPPGAGAPSGSIVVSDAGDSCEIPQGSTSCSIALGARGMRTLEAVFAGDDNFGASSATAAHLVNTPPVAADDSYPLDEDMSLNVAAQDGVLANDMDADGNALVVVNPGPFTAMGIGGEGVLNADGSFTYVPPPDASGTASLTYAISDGTATATATLEIVVAPVNDPPHFALAAVPGWPPAASGPKTQPVFAEVTDFGAPDESGQHVRAWLVRTIDDAHGVIVGNASISLDGTLGYTLSGHGGSALVGVRVQDDGGDANGGDDTSVEQTFTISVASGADLSVAIDDGTAFAIGGDPLLYMITVRNLGPDDASGARVHDILSANLVDATWTCTPSAGASCAAGGSGGIDDGVDLPSGATLVYELSATVLAEPESTVENDVSVVAPSGVADFNPVNDNASDIDTTGIFADGFDTGGDEGAAAAEIPAASRTGASDD